MVINPELTAEIHSLKVFLLIELQSLLIFRIFNQSEGVVRVVGAPQAANISDVSCQGLAVLSLSEAFIRYPDPTKADVRPIRPYLSPPWNIKDLKVWCKPQRGVMPEGR